MTAITFPQDFMLSAVMGAVQGISSLVIAAKSVNAQTTDAPFTIGFNNTLQGFATTVESWEIVSSSTNDAAAGTGARTVLVTYLDASYVQKTSLISLNGTTPVAIAADCFRHQSSVVVTAGTGTVNAGTLTIRVAGAGASRGLVTIGEGSSRQGSFTVPAGFRAYLQSTDLIIGKIAGATITADIAAYVRDATASVTRLGLDFTITEPGTALDFPIGIMIPEKLTLEYRATAIGTNGSNITVLASGLIVNTANVKWPLPP